MSRDKVDTFGSSAGRDLPLTTLTRMLRDLGINQIYAKSLASNDNSKNQIYLGGNFSAINLIPISTLEVFSPSSKKKRLEAGKKLVRGSVQFSWVDPFGELHEAPNTKIILYPQYPEVRFSGFLSGSTVNASEWMDVNKSGRSAGRYLIIGIHPDRYCVGYLAVPDSQISNELDSKGFNESEKLLQEVGSIEYPTLSSRTVLLRELQRIYRASPISGKKLNGRTKKSEPYHAPNGAGFTLEAELGVSPNGIAAPDFEGWEIKAHGSPVITLMTPEPSGGVYKDEGIDYFMRKYGYPAVNGEKDRLNFGGVHKNDSLTKRTQLTMRTIGYPLEDGKVDLSGAIALVDMNGEIAAEWSYEKLLSHWNRKHAKAAYVGYSRRTIGPEYAYYYDKEVYLGEGTDFLKFLQAVHNQDIYYDPGIKMVGASSIAPKVKKRSQFRVNFKNINFLYDKWEVVDLEGL